MHALLSIIFEFLLTFTVETIHSYNRPYSSLTVCAFCAFICYTTPSPQSL